MEKQIEEIEQKKREEEELKLTLELRKRKSKDAVPSTSSYVAPSINREESEKEE
jgi:hypothetical protein